MSLLQVNPCKHNTVQDIVTCVFPAIKSTDDTPTPAITSKTIGYIHALVMDTPTFDSTEAPYARALQNQAMICGELDKLTPAAFQTELSDCLVDYYDKVCLMVGAGGTLSIKTHKRKFKAAATTSEVVDEGVEEAAGAGAGEIEAAVASMSPASVRARATPVARIRASGRGWWPRFDAAAPAGGGRWGGGRRGGYAFAWEGDEGTGAKGGGGEPRPR